MNIKVWYCFFWAWVCAPFVNNGMEPLYFQVLIIFLEFKIVPCRQVSQAVQNGVDLVISHAIESLNQYFHQIIMMGKWRMYYRQIVLSVSGYHPPWLWWWRPRLHQWQDSDLGSCWLKRPTIHFFIQCCNHHHKENPKTRSTRSLLYREPHKWRMFGHHYRRSLLDCGEFGSGGSRWFGWVSNGGRSRS